MKVLLVDDDVVDRMAVLRGFSTSGINAEIQVATDGVQALEVLRGQDPNARLESPFFVLLDLNMPRMGGLEFLQEIRNDPTLRRTVVFVLSTSDSEEDQLAAYNHFVAGYVVKNKAGRKFERLMSMLEAYWNVVVLPGV